ncbi:hypothetical protein Elgi_54860 [Paenibacillus elgii]|nr:hypothetical protein Elgi_54860 [Paenibacillus elgii]
MIEMASGIIFRLILSLRHWRLRRHRQLKWLMTLENIIHSDNGKPLLKENVYLGEYNVTVFVEVSVR